MRDKRSKNSNKYAAGVVSSKKYQEQIDKHKQEQLIQELEEAKKARVVTTDWQPSALLCKRFGILDPFKHKKAQTYDFNKKPNQNYPKPGTLDFVTQNANSKTSNMIQGDEFFYKIQRNVERKEIIQQQFATQAKQEDNENDADIDIPSDSDMDSVEEGDQHTNLKNVISVANRPDADVFKNIFN